MVMLTPGKTVRSREPLLAVDNVLKLGAWRFQLTVVDNDRNESDPAELVVKIVREVAPPPPPPPPSPRPFNPIDVLVPRRPVVEPGPPPPIRPRRPG